MEVRAKKALGQHFLTDQDIARRIVGALQGSPVLEVGPGTGVLTRLLLTRNRVNIPPAFGSDGIGHHAALADEAGPDGETTATLGMLRGGTADGEDGKRTCSLGDFGDGGGAERSEAVEPQEPASSVGIDEERLKAVEIDRESVAYLRKHFPELGDGLIEGDFLKMNLGTIFPEPYSIIGNFPYNISSQIFFKILDYKDQVPEVVCMIQKEVAERIAEKPGTKTYGILSVLLQAWYDIEYLFTVGPGAFNPPPKVHSAVIRLTRNSRTSLGCDERLFRSVVKTSFGQRRKTLRNSLKPLVQNAASAAGSGPDGAPAGALQSAPVFDLRPERLSVEDFIELTRLLQP